MAGKIMDAHRTRNLPACTAHSNAAKHRMSTAAARCCSTSGEEKLAQKGRGPRGQFSGSARSRMKMDRPAKESGQKRAQRMPGKRLAKASSPAANTTKPSQGWVYSDHSRSVRSLAPVGWNSATCTSVSVEVGGVSCDTDGLFR